MNYPRISFPSLVIVLALLNATRLGANQVTYSYDVGRGGTQTFTLNFSTNEFGYVNEIHGSDEAGAPETGWTAPSGGEDDGGPKLTIDWGDGRILTIKGSELTGTPDAVEGAVLTELQSFLGAEHITVTGVPEGGPSLALTALVLCGFCLVAGVRGRRFASRTVHGI